MWQKLLCYTFLLSIFIVESKRDKRSATECPEGIVENEANFRVFITISALAKGAVHLQILYW